MIIGYVNNQPVYKASEDKPAQKPLDEGSALFFDLEVEEVEEPKSDTST